MNEAAQIDRQRVDKWLWFSRMVKTRTLAGKLVLAGKLRINRLRISKPSHMVRPGDVLTFVHCGRLKTIRIRALGARRAPAAEARRWYEDLSPPMKRAGDRPGSIDPGPARRRDGAGRPTKKERRDLDRWLDT